MINWSLIAALAMISLATSLLIETSSWWLRSFSRPGNVGLYISRTNIYLYGGRFFALLFSTFIAILVDQQVSTERLLELLAIGFAGTGVAHLVLLNDSRFTLALVIRIARLMRMSPPDIEHHHPRSPADRESIRTPTALSSMFFGLGLSLPYVLASMMPEYRLTIGNLGQVINSFGTLLLLFWVDQRLFAALDKDRLQDAVVHYGRGRAIGFLIVAAMFGVTIAVVRLGAPS